MKSAREIDTNGWIEIKKNPISKCGVFPYLGGSIPIKGLEAGKFYNVYRPAEELNSPETIESFKLLPWIDDHAMIGPNEDTPAEVKGIHGVTGEDVFFEEPFLYANLKLFSEKLGKKIENEKRELSLGYKADWALEDGIYNGVPYQVVQRNIRGNHLALVNEGRSGHQVAVLDHKETLDEVSLMEPEKKEDASSLPSLSALVGRLESAVEKLLGAQQQETAEATDAEEKKKDDTAKEEPAQDEEEKKDDKKSEEGKAMDEAELSRHIFSQMSRRDALAKRAFKDERVGVFDASEMTLGETEKYLVKKLGLSCPQGHEGSVLAGYFAGAVVSQPVNTQAQSGAAMDGKSVKSPQIRKILYGEE